MTRATESPYRFRPHERPAMLGSPFNPDHPPQRMAGYFIVGILTGLTAGLGNALVTANLTSIQGGLGLYSDEAAWLPAAYVMTNVCANLVLVRVRVQFGLQAFVRWILIAFVLVTAAHLFVLDFWTAVIARAASGIAAAGLTTLCILALMQAMPAPKRLAGILIGIGIPQLAIPVARIISPSLLEWGDWRMAYVFELGLALATLAALTVLPLPPSERARAFERADALTLALVFPGIALLCAALGLGRIVWWTDAPWIAYALIGAILLLAAGIAVEHRRSNPLLQTGFLTMGAIVRIALVAISVRILVSEQTFGSIGLLGVVGMGPDQFPRLYAIVLLASIAGIVASVVMFKPDKLGRPIRIACVAIAIGAFLDAGSNNLTRPENLYISQALIGFGALLFIGPAMLTGIARMLLAGPKNFITWVVVFSATQNIGGLVGPALFGTFQTIREKFHSHELVQQIVLTNPLVAQRIGDGGSAVAGVISDPVLRSAEGTALLAGQVTREANILAFNDVFLAIGSLAVLAFIWGFVIEIGMRRRGEKSPVVLLAEMMAAATAAAERKEGAQ